MSEWQPIETAPLNGTEVLGWDGVSMVVMGFVAGEWLEAYECEYTVTPTHWIPLPEPPTG